jgi:hypothetical protein
MPSIHIAGTVIDVGSESGLGDARVKAAYSGVAPIFAAAETDDAGKFRVQFELNQQDAPRGLDNVKRRVQFQVFDSTQGDVELLVKQDAVQWSGSDGRFEVKVPVTIPVNREQLLELAKHAKRTPDEIKRSNPQLSARLNGATRRRLRMQIERTFARSSEELKELIKGFAFVPDDENQLDFKLRLLKLLRQKGASEEVIKEARRKLRRLKTPEKVSDALPAARPIGEDPTLNRQIRQGITLQLGDISKLPEDKGNRLIEQGATFRDLNEAMTARGLGGRWPWGSDLVFCSCRLTLAHALPDATSDVFGGRRLKSVEHLRGHGSRAVAA